jgi:hypothetical protein
MRASALLTGLIIGSVLFSAAAKAALPLGDITDSVAVRQLDEMYNGCLTSIRTPGEKFWSWASHVSGGLLADPLPDCSPDALARMKAAWEAKNPPKPDDGLLMKSMMPAFRMPYPSPSDACPPGYYEAGPPQPQLVRQPRICVEIIPR